MAGKRRWIGSVHSLIAVQAVLALSACAPSGYRYGKWSDGPTAAFTLTPTDDCQRPEAQRGLISALNGRASQSGGPSDSITSAEGLTTIPNGAIDGPTLTCRGTLQTAGGPIGPGVVVLKLADNGSRSAIVVKDATWEADADRERREAQERKERARQVAEAPAREAKMTADMRASALSEPNKTVHCGINRSHFWTTNAVCFALIEEAKYVSSKFGKASRDEILHECARNIARRLPGKDRPTYLNACEELIASYGA